MIFVVCIYMKQCSQSNDRVKLSINSEKQSQYRILQHEIVNQRSVLYVKINQKFI